MEWLNSLIKKLPTLKGIADCFYVATHWSTISQEREEYRRQITDRDQWIQSRESTLKKLHELEKEKVTKELEAKIKDWQDAARWLADPYIDAVIRLALFYHLEPLRWEFERSHLNPGLVQSIERVMTNLPKPPLSAVALAALALAGKLPPPPGTLLTSDPDKK